MYILFLIIVFLLAYTISNDDKNTKVINKNTCPPHKWVNDQYNHLYCDNCKYRPGEIPTNYDKPY